MEYRMRIRFTKEYNYFEGMMISEYSLERITMLLINKLSIQALELGLSTKI